MGSVLDLARLTGEGIKQHPELVSMADLICGVVNGEVTVDELKGVTNLDCDVIDFLSELQDTMSSLEEVDKEVCAQEFGDRFFRSVCEKWYSKNEREIASIIKGRLKNDLWAVIAPKVGKMAFEKVIEKSTHSGRLSPMELRRLYLVVSDSTRELAYAHYLALFHQHVSDEDINDAVSKSFDGFGKGEEMGKADTYETIMQCPLNDLDHCIDSLGRKLVYPVIRDVVDSLDRYYYGRVFSKEIKSMTLYVAEMVQSEIAGWEDHNSEAMAYVDPPTAINPSTSTSRLKRRPSLPTRKKYYKRVPRVKPDFIPKSLQETQSFQIQSSRSSWLRRLFARSRNLVYSAVYAPTRVPLHHSFRVQVHLFLPDQTRQSVIKATVQDPDTTVGGFNPLSLRLKKGDQVTIDLWLNDQDSLIGQRTKKIEWQGQLTSVDFHVRPTKAEMDCIVGEATFSVQGAPIGTVSFMTRIDSAKPVDETATREIATVFKKAFISYSHKDVRVAELFATAYRAQGTRYFFDRHSLETGDLFNDEIIRNIEDSDLFLLLWSQNTVSSEYVKKEYTHALQFARPQKSQEDATITIKPYLIEPYADLPDQIKEHYEFTTL